jgi:hypothetical protein
VDGILKSAAKGLLDCIDIEGNLFPSFPRHVLMKSIEKHSARIFREVFFRQDL